MGLQLIYTCWRLYPVLLQSIHLNSVLAPVFLCYSIIGFCMGNNHYELLWWLNMADIISPNYLINLHLFYLLYHVLLPIYLQDHDNIQLKSISMKSHVNFIWDTEGGSIKSNWGVKKFIPHTFSTTCPSSSTSFIDFR